MPKADIHFEVTPINPNAHLFQIDLCLAHPSAQGQVFSLPAWIPGSYMIRDFARQIIEISAFSDGQPVDLVKLDKQTWQAPSVRGSLTLRYQVYAWDLSVRSAHLDQTHGFFNGSSLFLRIDGQEKNRITLDIRTPDGEDYSDWQIATTLPQPDEGHYVAEDYAHLIDCPVEMGSFQRLAFEAHGVPHEMVVSGRVQFDTKRIAEDLAKICAQHARLFEELPVQRYLFLTQAVAEGYGGLEHRDSTALICKKTDLPPLDMAEPSEGYVDFMGLCSHEYFHLWNVKRIAPQQLLAADLASESYTRLLWAFEGITSYYDDLAVLRAGCIDIPTYLKLVARNITRVMRTPGRFRQSVAESSFDAWTRFYKQDENSPNAIVSYYAKGALVAFGLDMILRDSTNDQTSLDDLMRALWREYGQPGIGVPEDGIERLASQLSATDLTQFFAQAVYGTEDLPLANWFESLGISYRLRPAKGAEDKGGSCGADESVTAAYEIGARFTQKGDLVELTYVRSGGAAQLAGLSAGDRLIAIDKLQVTASNLPKVIAASQGSRMDVLAFRRDELMHFELQPMLTPNDTCDLWLSEDDQCTPAQLARRSSWIATR